MIEVFVESIRVNMTNYKRVVMLKEKAGERYLPIWVGHFEADAIAIPMQNVPVNRPLTHDFAASAIASLGGTVTQAVVSELTDQTFFAKVVVDADGRQVEIDSRPSDAIAIAIRAKVPIYVEDAVMDTAGMTFDPNAPSESAPAAVAPERRGRRTIAATDLPSADPDVPAYLPGAEPAGDQPGTPFTTLGSVTAPLLATLRRVLANAENVNRRPIGPGDLLTALLSEQRAAANGVLRSLSVDLDELEVLVDREIPRDYPAVLTPAAEAIVERAVAEAARLGESTVSTEHLLLALAGQMDSSVAVALDGLGISADALRRQIAVILTPPSDEQRSADHDEADDAH